MIFGYAVLDRTNRPFTSVSGVALFPATMRAAADRLNHWISVGAQPSETVERLIKQNAAKVA